jgi:hypothetical protein
MQALSLADIRYRGSWADQRFKLVQFGIRATRAPQNFRKSRSPATLTHSRSLHNTSPGVRGTIISTHPDNLRTPDFASSSPQSTSRVPNHPHSSQRPRLQHVVSGPIAKWRPTPPAEYPLIPDDYAAPSLRTLPHTQNHLLCPVMPSRDWTAAPYHLGNSGTNVAEPAQAHHIEPPSQREWLISPQRTSATGHCSYQAAQCRQTKPPQRMHWRQGCPSNALLLTTRAWNGPSRTHPCRRTTTRRRTRTHTAPPQSALPVSGGSTWQALPFPRTCLHDMPQMRGLGSSVCPFFCTASKPFAEDGLHTREVKASSTTSYLTKSASPNALLTSVPVALSKPQPVASYHPANSAVPTTSSPPPTKPLLTPHSVSQHLPLSERTVMGETSEERLPLMRCGEASPHLQSLPGDKAIFSGLSNHFQCLTFRGGRPVVLTLERDTSVVTQVDPFDLGTILRVWKHLVLSGALSDHVCQRIRQPETGFRCAWRTFSVTPTVDRSGHGHLSVHAWPLHLAKL